MGAEKGRGGYFITGTGTGCGKTVTTTALLHAFNAAGMTANGMKPVASGCDLVDGRLVNADAREIRNGSASTLAYELVNPVALAAAVAPHIAAARAGTAIDLDRITRAFHGIQEQSDVVLVEGAGGWRVPLTDSVTWTWLVQQLRLPVILVVGLRLGCINHARLTAETIAADGARLDGWVACGIDPHYGETDETISHLGARLSAPLLGYLPHDPEPRPARFAPCLDLSVLHCAAY